MEWSPKNILVVFIVLKILRLTIEIFLGFMNRKFYLNSANQVRAKEVLKVSEEDWSKTVHYTNSKFIFNLWSNLITSAVVLIFIYHQYLGFVQNFAVDFAQKNALGTIFEGLLFFAILGALSFVLQLPFEIYSTFGLEKKFGFNKQTPIGFILDKCKMIVLSVLLGGLLVSGLLWVMERLGQYWWIYAWGLMTFFSLLVAYLFPVVLAPLFNKFKPLESGELKEALDKLATKIQFKTSGISVMDASKRSTHANAYFTGLFGAKKIVLFDTLLHSLSTAETVAVLAHELGHFKLGHVRSSLIKSVVISGVTFYLLSLALPHLEFYQAFGLQTAVHYAALTTFSLWFGAVDFFLTPIASYFSQKNEFAADQFAKDNIGSGVDLGAALLKLRQKSFAMPLTHPLYAKIYYSHPPLLIRLEELLKV